VATPILNLLFFKLFLSIVFSAFAIPVAIMIINSGSEHEDPDVKDMEDDAPANTIHPYQSNTTTIKNIEYELEEHMGFSSKDSMIFVIRQFHIKQGYKFVVVKSKTDKYVVRCIDYNNGCQWRLRTSYSKIRDQWEIKRIEVPHTCLSTVMSQDHVNLDSHQIISIMVNSVRKNLLIPIKSLIA